MIASLVGLYRLAKSNLGATAVALLGVIALCAMSWCWGFAKGEFSGQVGAERSTRKSVELAHQRYRERVQAGSDAVRSLLSEIATRNQLIDDLKRKTRHVPSFVSTPQCPDPGNARLSVGVVGLYDAALGGGDRQLPASACGAAAGSAGAGAPAGQACGRASDVTADDFRHAAQANAERFALCRFRLNQLTQLLRARDEKVLDSSAAVGGAFER